MSLENNNTNDIMNTLQTAWQTGGQKNAVFKIEENKTLTPVEISNHSGASFFSAARDYIANNQGTTHAVIGEWSDGKQRAAFTVNANSRTEGIKILEETTELHCTTTNAHRNGNGRSKGVFASHTLELKA